ncbi:MAG: 50S ribosomal protein L28 [Bacteroidales bacterium]|nr:50S ribosomal protein L28 [Bacteroidales bacterium]MDD4603668.1 50S ribosomal protein L28 [Bacteroidales bacterium]
MSRICDLTGKSAMKGNSVSHSNKKTKRWFNANIQTKTFFVPEENREIKMKVTASAMRTIDKKGVYACIKEAREKGFLNK